MNRGLMLKAVYEIWPATLFCGVLLFGVELLLAFVLPTFQGQFSDAMLQIDFIQTLVGAMLGVDIAGRLGPEVFAALPWVHPVALALVWAHVIQCCTRMPAGEIDRGTADITLTLNVTRWEILRSETATWILAGLIVLVLGLAGNEIGWRFAPAERRPDLGRTLIVFANLCCVYLAVGGLSWLASVFSDRRGLTILVVFVVLLSSLLLNFVAQFWDFAKHLSFLGILDYYRPLFILRDGKVPWGDMSVLLGLAIGLWIAAGIQFSRRDVCTT